MLLSVFCMWFVTLWKSRFPRNPPTPWKLLPFNPPPLSLRISNDLPWWGYGYFLEPHNDCLIYLNHSNGIHYDVVLDVNADDSTESISQTSLSDDIHNFEAKKKSQLNDELTNVEFQRKRKVNTTIPVLHTSKDKNKCSQTKNHFTKKTKKQKQTTQTSLSDDIGNVEAEKRTQLNEKLANVQFQRKRKANPTFPEKSTKKTPILPENKDKKKGPQKKNGFTKAENQKPTPQNDLHKLAVKNMMKFHKS